MVADGVDLADGLLLVAQLAKDSAWELWLSNWVVHNRPTWEYLVLDGELRASKGMLSSAKKRWEAAERLASASGMWWLAERIHALRSRGTELPYPWGGHRPMRYEGRLHELRGVRRRLLRRGAEQEAESLLASLVRECLNRGHSLSAYRYARAIRLRGATASTLLAATAAFKLMGDTARAKLAGRKAIRMAKAEGSSTRVEQAQALLQSLPPPNRVGRRRRPS